MRSYGERRVRHTVRVMEGLRIKLKGRMSVQDENR